MTKDLEKNQMFVDFLQKVMRHEIRTIDGEERSMYFFNTDYLEKEITIWDDFMSSILFDNGFEVYDYHYEWIKDYFNKFQEYFIGEEWNIRTWEEFATHKTLNDIHDKITEDLEADNYNSDLLKWYASRITNPGLMDEALEEIGGEYDAVGRLQIAQRYAIMEIYTIGFNVLTSLIEWINE